MKRGRSSRGSPWRPLLLLLGISLVGYVPARADQAAGELSAADSAGESPATAAADSSTAPAREIIAYYFHTSFRCASCKKIEAYSDEAIREGFPSELADGRLLWSPVNTDEKDNEHFVKDFKLYTKSVIVAEMRDGALVRWKNLPKVWELIGNKPAFLKYVRDEVAAYLDGQT